MRSAQLDDAVLSYLAERARATGEEFGRPVGELPVLEWGDGPQLRSPGAEGRPAIVVARRDADWWRIRYQIAHEVFHWLCGPDTYHWTHEFLAVETALRAMRGLGEHDYARRTVDGLVEEAAILPLAAMLSTPVVPGPLPGLYGRAWLTGVCLVEAVGWERVKLLADPRPDVGAWVRSLPAPARARAEAVLGRETAAWAAYDPVP